MLCDIGQHGAGLEYIRHAVGKGYCVAPTLASSRHFDALRNDPVLQKTLADAETRRQHALAAFRQGGGHRLLGG